MTTDKKEGIKRNITIGTVITIFLILVGWIYNTAQWQSTVDIHMKNTKEKNENQDKVIEKIYNKLDEKNILFVPRTEFKEVIKRLDDRNETMIDLLKEIRTDVKINNRKQ